jgi:hypothetical protein
MSVTRTATGRTASSITYRNLGLNVKVTPRMSGEGVLTLDLETEESRAVTPEDGPIIGLDEKEQPIRAATFPSDTVNGRFIVPNDQMVLAKSFKTTSKAGESRTLVLVTATVLGGK